MRHLVSNLDSSVIVMTMVPNRVRKTDGTVVLARVSGIKRKQLAPDVGVCLLYGVDANGQPVELVVGSLNFDTGELNANSLPGYIIEFPTPDGEIQKWGSGAKDFVLSHRPLSNGQMFTDRTFRDAWEDNGQLVVNMPKARNIHRDRMRVVRESLLRQADVDQLRALVAKDQKDVDDVEVKKQALRDVTADPAIEAAQTPEELKVIWPIVLNG